MGFIADEFHLAPMNAAALTAGPAQHGDCELARMVAEWGRLNAASADTEGLMIRILETEPRTIPDFLAKLRFVSFMLDGDLCDMENDQPFAVAMLSDIAEALQRFGERQGA